MKRLPRALTIAGSDSGGGAGIQADLKTFAARGVWGTSVVAALTAQDTRRVHASLAVPPPFVRRQLEAVLGDIGVDAVKTGMLLDRDVVALVARVLARRRVRNLVVDPVMVAKRGDRLLAADAVATVVRRLIPLATVVTPNLAEAAALVGFPVRDLTDMTAAAHALCDLGARAAVVKGGHLRGDAVDVLVCDGRTTTLRAPRLPITPPHGTGCTFAAAIAAELAKGADVRSAVRIAKRYTHRCIVGALRVGRGSPVLDHFAGR
jgi:hydroxymethylpyrimidine kinase/phosphomethylpyrimidine kinase